MNLLTSTFQVIISLFELNQNLNFHLKIIKSCRPGVSLLIFLTLPFQSYSQSFSLTGHVIEENITPLHYATVAILLPEDSTLAYYGITNTQGLFEIKNIKTGSYLLQVAFLGYETFYKKIEFPGQPSDAGAIRLNAKVLELNEALVSAERIPLLIKNDTIEYDAASYKTKPDAAVEDLLKKLPGMEVDRSGNIKAQGENVQNVLVDGKEFFGNDPKIATKNLPSDAVDKVQVFDKKSDEAELTGVDDGIRSKTVNLLLKENKKSAWLGELNAGVGTDDHYQTVAKAYRFTKTKQFAALGMLNNINQFGFTFQDYIDFSGGFRGLSDGTGDISFKLNDDSSFPVNFGQPVTGLINSGAAGLNFSYEKNKDDRISTSYVVNGAQKKLIEISRSNNYTESGSFILNENNSERTKNFNHRINLAARKKVGTNHNILINGSGSLSTAELSGTLMSSGKSNDKISNELFSNRANSGDGYNLKAGASYFGKWVGKWKLLKAGGDISAYSKKQNSDWSNSIRYFEPFLLLAENRYLNESESSLKYSANTSVTRSIGKKSFLIPGIKAGITIESLEKVLGESILEKVVIDSLSSDLHSEYQWFRPALTYKRNTDKSQFSISAQLESGTRYSTLRSIRQTDETLLFFIPQISWNKEYRKGRNLDAGYTAEVSIPEARQLYPISYNNNSVQRMLGNRNLQSEYIQSLYIRSMIFDQFSFTSLFTGLNARYTKDKINWSRTVDEQLNQVLKLVNVREDYSVGSTVEFNTPVRKLQLNLSVDWQERWNRGINLVNTIENTNTNFTHSASVKVDNRKKQKWDAAIGAGLDFTQARYSIVKQLNNDYLSLNYFTEISFTPNEKWNLNFIADITQYKSKGFQESHLVPLLKASLSRYLLKNGRLVIGIEIFDILDKNSGIKRVSELNYLQEKQSNTIGRYVMLNLKFRLNKFSKGDEGKINIDIK